MTDSQKRRYADQYMTDGTSARKLDVTEYGYAVRKESPVREEEPERKESPATNPAVRRKNSRRTYERTQYENEKTAKQSAIPAINVVAMLTIAVAVIAAAYTCLGYLKVQADIVSVGKKITALENATAELASANNYTELEIEKSIDYDTILTVATEELGMVYPYDNQMITYETSNKGYVRQYGELLGNEEETTVSVLLKMFRSR